MRVSVLFASVVLSAALASQPALAKDTKRKAKVDSSKYYDMDQSDVMADNNDPWEGFNRPIFEFNVGLDRHVFKPFISLYSEIPAPARRSFGNFLTNLSEPLNVVHGILQLDPKVAFTSFWRFLLNTTFGLLGLNDFARESASLRNMDQDLGKTLGIYGVPTGPYMVLPVVGPSTVRDTAGMVGDWFLDPVRWYETTPTTVGHTVAVGINTRDTQSKVIEHLYYDSLDPYVATRSAYQQNKSFRANNQ
jgi:phospholipid-binding lipoprotein MlaA